MKQNLAIWLFVSFALAGCDQPSSIRDSAVQEPVKASAVETPSATPEPVAPQIEPDMNAQQALSADKPAVHDQKPSTTASKPHPPQVRATPSGPVIQLPPLRLDMRLPDELSSDSDVGEVEGFPALLPRLVDAEEPPSLMHLSGRLLPPNERQDVLVDGAEIQLEFKH